VRSGNARGRLRRVVAGGAALWRRLPWLVRKVPVAGLVVLVLAAVPFGWTRMAARGHLFDAADVPAADVVLVLGSQVTPEHEPMPVLRGRLDTAAQLVRDGWVRVVLVSGDAGGHSGNETSVMTAYLRRQGVEADRIVADPHGLDTYDSCLRAKQVYGLTRLLVVTQPYHLSRAVALCRNVGVDADGVRAGCGGCALLTLTREYPRDYLAATKAAWDAFSDRKPAVTSPPSPAVADALARLAARSG
jgi:vancomycin permeability regulator SanA